MIFLSVCMHVCAFVFRLPPLQSTLLPLLLLGIVCRYRTSCGSFVVCIIYACNKTLSSCAPTATASLSSLFNLHIVYALWLVSFTFIFIYYHFVEFWLNKWRTHTRKKSKELGSNSSFILISFVSFVFDFDSISCRVRYQFILFIFIYYKNNCNNNN